MKIEERVAKVESVLEIHGSDLLSLKKSRHDHAKLIQSYEQILKHINKDILSLEKNVENNVAQINVKLEEVIVYTNKWKGAIVILGALGGAALIDLVRVLIN